MSQCASNSPQGGEGNPGNNLHVSGLSTRVEDRDLDEVFSKFGQVSASQPVIVSLHGRSSSIAVNTDSKMPGHA